MSNVEPYNIMRNCTLRNITAVIATILSLTMGGSPADAQKVYKCYYTGDGTELSETKVSEKESAGAMCSVTGSTRRLFDASSVYVKEVAGSEKPSGLSQYGAPVSIYLYAVSTDDEGNEVLEELDFIDRDHATDGASEGGLISAGTDGIVQYEMSTKNQIYGSTVGTGSRLNFLSVNAYNTNFDNMLQYQGKTLMVRVNFGKTISAKSYSVVVDTYFDMIGAKYPGIQSSVKDNSPSNLSPDDPTWAYFMPCPDGKPVEMTITGNENPYGTTASYLGNVYSVKYAWLRSSDDFGREQTAFVTNLEEDNKTYSDLTVTSQTRSGGTEYRPYSVIYRNGEYTGCVIPMSTTYDIYLYQPLEAYNSFTNQNSGATSSESGASSTVNKFYACYGDDVTYTPSFRQQELDGVTYDLESGVYWALYQLNDDGSIAATLKDFHSYEAGESYTFSNLTETTSYKIVAEYDDDELTLGYHHRNGDISSHPCPTEKYFTIEVRQMSASSQLKFPEDKVCENSDATIKATVSGIAASDSIEWYSYRWYYSDDNGQNYTDLNTSDWVDSDDADWSDPTAGIETVMKSVKYPNAADGIKYVKFLLANTYKIGGTTYYCEMPTVGSFEINKKPVIDKPDALVACEGQPVSFQLLLNDYSANPDDGSSVGMTYNVYSDTTSYTSARGTVVPIYGMLNGDSRNDGVAEDTYNENRLGSTGRFMWWVVQKAEAGQYKFYTTVKNEETTCVSYPVETVINVLPLPEVTSASPDPSSFCLNADPTGLKVLATISDTYSSFDYSSANVPTPTVSYHWSWFYPDGVLIDSTTVTSITLADKFSDNRLTLYKGNVVFSVYATDNQKCGYQLNFDGTVKTGDDGSQLQATQSVETTVRINDKPDFTIELPSEDDYICGDAGQVKIKLTSKDSRPIKFTFTPKDGTTVTSTNSPVSVGAYSSGEFIVNFDESDVNDEQKFEFDYVALDLSNTEQECDSSSSISFTVHERPQLEGAKVTLCYDQTTEFYVRFKKNIPIPNEGLTYSFTFDKEGYTSASGWVNPKTSYSGTTATEVKWKVEKQLSEAYANGGMLTLYAWVKDEKTGCKSDPTEVHFIILPQPNIESLTLSKDAYCRNESAAELTVTANVSTGYSNFNYDAYSVPKPKMEYRWTWTNGKGQQIGSKTVTDDNVLSDGFDGLTSEVSATVNDVKGPQITLYIADSNGCGVVWDAEGNSTGTPVSQVSTNLTINALPYTYVEADAKACAGDGKAIVHVGSNDDRALSLTFTPVSADGVTATGSLSVGAKSTGSEFVAQFDEDKIKDVTTFTYSVHAADYYPGCSTDTTLTFTVYPSPVLTFSPDAAERHVCQGSDITLSVAASIKDNGKDGEASRFTYNWQCDGVTVGSSRTFTWTAPEDAQVGDHTICCTVLYSFSDGQVCSKTENITVFVNPRPTITFGSDVTICEGETTTLTGSVSNGYANNHLNNYTNTFTPTISPELTRTDAGNFTWTYSAAPTKTTTYSFSVTNDVTGCESLSAGTANVSVDRKAHFKVTSLSKTEVCEGNYDITVSIKCQNRSEFDQVNWNGFTAFGFNVVSADDNTIVLNGDLKATSASTKVSIGASIFNAKTAAGCDVVFDNNLEITVRQNPEAPVIEYVSSTNNKEYVCKGQNQTINYRVANSTQGDSYEWFVSKSEPAADATPDKTATANNPTFTVNTHTLTEDTYVWVRARRTRYSNTKCPSAFASKKLEVKPVPKPAYSVEEICAGEMGVIKITAPVADANNSYTYSFYKSNDTDNPLQEGASSSYTTDELTASARYFIDVKNNESGCTSEILPVDVVVNKNPVGKSSVAYQDSEGKSTLTDPFGNVINRAAFCEGEQGKAIVTLNPTLSKADHTFKSTLVSVSSGSVSDWSKDSESVWSCSSNHTWNEGCTLTFTVEDETTGCKSEPFTATVAVKPGLPTPVIVNSGESEVCYDVNTNISIKLASAYDYASTTIAYAYYMYDKKEGTLLEGPTLSRDGSLSSSTSSLNIKADVYFLVYAYDAASGCLSPASNSVAIKVNELPVPTISVTESVLCPEEETTMSVKETFKAYNWLDGDTQGKTTQSVTVKLKATETFRVQVTDEKGCVSEPVSTTITVHPRPAFHMEADPATVCQNSTDDVIIKIVPENADKVDFANNYSFTTLTGDGVVTSRTNASGGTEYVVTGHTWTEASETFQATVNSTEEYNSCLSEEKTVTVYVISALPKPEALAPAPQDGTLTNDVHVCTGATDELTAYVTNKSGYPTTGGVTYTYHWYSDPEGANELTGSPYTVDQSAGTISFVPTADITLYVKAVRETDPKCSSELSNVLRVTIEALPEAPAVLAPNPKYVCQPEMKDDPVQLLISNPATDNIYHWYTAADDAEIGQTSGTTPLSIQAPTKTTAYYARTESKYGCLSSDKSEVVEVSVGTNPVIKKISSTPENICSGDAIHMFVGVEGDSEDVTYVYTITSSYALSKLTGKGTVDGSGVLTTIQLHVQDTETLTYTFKAVYGDHCYSENSVAFTVTVHGKPTVTDPVIDPNPICEGEKELTIHFDDVSSHDGSESLEYVRIVDAQGNVLVTHSDHKNGWIEFSLYESDFPEGGIKRDMLPLSVEVKDKNCSLTKALNLELNDNPDFDIESKNGGLEVDGKLNFCVNDTITLDVVKALPETDTQGNALTYQYQWYKNERPISGAVRSRYQMLNVETGNSGTYTLEVTSYRGVTKACTFTRSIDIVVNDLPEAVIDGWTSSGYFCTDGDLDLYGNEDMIRYDWTIATNPEFKLTKKEGDDGFDNHIVKKLSDLNITKDETVEIRLTVTDKLGCKSIETSANIFTAVPPVISAVNGIEACKDKSFVITVEQDRSEYTPSLYSEDGTTEVEGCIYDAATHSITTSADLPEGNYVLRVKDDDTQCTTDSTIYLTRYDIEPVFRLLPDGSRFFCYNSLLSYELTLEENNGHDDFFDKIEDVKIGITYTYNNEIVHTEAPVTITENKLLVEFYPNDPNYDFRPSDQAYFATATVSYKLKSDPENILSCERSADQNLRIVEVPVVVSDPSMPVCLADDITFIVDEANVAPSDGGESYVFYVNGVQVVNSSGDYSSNELKMSDHPEIELNDGDLITAEVVMDWRGNKCMSDPFVVKFKADFNPVIENINMTDELCLGSDINFDIVSRTPESMKDSAEFVNRRIKSYKLFIIDSKGESQYGDVVDLSSGMTNSTAAKVVYSGEDTSIKIYAQVTDEDDCEYKTDEVVVKINQFKISDVVVTNTSGVVMTADDLCADVDYNYRAIITDGDGNVITPGENYDFTFTMDGVEWSDHSTGKFLVDSVTNKHAVTDGYIAMVVNVTNLVTGCKTDATINLYKPYSENFKFHEQPTPNEKLLENYAPYSENEPRKYEICYGNDFTFSVNGNDVTVVYDGNPVARYVKGAIDGTFNGATLPTSSISSEQVSDTESRFAFSIEPSAEFHTVQFIVSDGTCEVASDEWQFRKFAEVIVSALNSDKLDLNVDNSVTVCQFYPVEFIPSTAEPNYNSGYNFTLNGELVSASDYTDQSYKFKADAVGVFELRVIPKFGNGSCYTTVTIDVKQSPIPSVSLGDIARVDSAACVWSYAFCENQDLTLTLGGAETYQAYDFTIDGVAADAFVEPSGAGALFSQTVNLPSRAKGNGFTTYSFKVNFNVANCSEGGSVTFYVYNNPEAKFINETPKSLVISGAEVPVEVTDGFANYKFIVNDTIRQEGTSNKLAGDLNKLFHTSTIEVVVTNEFGCDTTLTAEVKVLDDVEIKTIEASSDYYCSEDAGVRIKVVDPQDGLTYKLVNTGQTVVCTDGSDVFWDPVRVADPAHENPEEFRVIAYYEDLNDQVFDMSNTVKVEEVPSPAQAVADDLKGTNCQVVQKSDFTWNVASADTSNYYWLVGPDGTEFGPMKPTSTSLDIPVYDLLFAAYAATPNGDYKIVARTKSKYGQTAGQYVCEKTLQGTLTIDIPTTESFDVKMSPANGNVCLDDLKGVDIFIEQSDYSEDFSHVYVLYQDSVEIARKTSTSDRGEIRFSNINVATAGHYVFSIVCEFNGCSQAMSGTQKLNVYDYPDQQTLTVDNDGYFCYDADGATITVGGQQEDYLYRLFRNGYDSWTSTDADGNETTVSYSHKGDDSGLPFSFTGIKEQGTYSVKVYIPDLDRFETSCVTELNSVVEVHPMAEPEMPDAHINKSEITTVGGKSLTVCVDEAARITLLQPEKWDLPNFEVHYKVYDEAGNLITETEVENLSNSNRVVFEDFTAQKVGLEAGFHKLTVVSTQSRTLSDGTTIECQKEFEEALKLYVKNRPSDGTESIYIDSEPEGLKDDPCYGIDLVVNNANTSVTDSVEYRLFLVDKLSGIESFVTSIKPYDGDEPRFKDIRNGDGNYIVRAYNGACYDDIPPVPVHVVVDKYAAVQTLDVEDFMCQGDAGVSAGLMDSEKNVIYRLWYVAPADWHDFSQQYLVDSTPGTMISEFNKATFDHQRVTFTNVDYGDGSSVTDLINRDGYYYVICIKDEENACPVASPAVNFQSLKLPKSFNLMENRFYCDPDGGVQLYVEHSEIDPDAVITYKLYQKDDAENLTYRGEVVSDGSDMLTFKNNGQDVTVQEGTYSAIALKEYSIESNGQIKKHICTSAMATEVVVKLAEPLDALSFEAETILTCNGAGAEFTLPDASLKEGVVYHLTGDSSSPETALRESVNYDGSGSVTFSNLVNGENVIWASYTNFDCLVEIGRVSLTHHPAIPQNYSGTVCGDENLEVQICDERFLLDGLTYWLVDPDGNVASQFTLNTATDSCVTLTGLQPQTYTLFGAFGGVDGECATEMGVIVAVNPDASATLYVAGESYKPGATVEMCPGLFAMASIEIKNAVASKYIFYFKPDGSDEADVVYEGASNACSLTSYIKEQKTSQGVLSFAIETVCGEYVLDDLFTIKIKGSASGDNHLHATNDALYCEGKPTVQLYYDDAKYGDIYRLYKVSSDSIVDPGDNNTYDDELMDMQEIPRNVGESGNYSKILYFNGWGYFNGENSVANKDFASAGCYYVETTDDMGCTYISDVVCVQVAEPPIASTDSAFYVYQNPDDGTLDMTTKDNNYGYVGGVIALPNPIPGVTYYLMRDGEEMSYDDEAGLNHEITCVAQEGDEYVIFGPIKDYLDEYPSTIVVRDGVIYSGEGVYQIKATTDCESVSNSVTFIGEQLVAYDVEIYLNKNEMSRITDLIPNYDFTTHVSYKSNRKYIGWSSKIDRIYRPKVVTGSDGYYENDNNETSAINSDDDPNYFRDGYTNVEGTYKQEKSKITYTGKSGSSNVWFNIVDDPTNKVSGSYGFINVDYTASDSSVISTSTPTGYFFYMKQPSFYGVEKIKYYVENYQMPGRRSNIATITILCGNEEVNDSSSVFLIPNAFSPNGDGLNDVFKIVIPEKYEDNSESKLQVFNRWGTLVYRSTGLKYGEDGNWWDGTSSTSNMVTLGQQLPSGTYYYVFSITFIDKVHAVKSERKMHGFIELRR